MRGAGTKLAITANNPPPARLLDITRLVSRAGRVLTGVDRVELAYLRHLAAGDVPLFGLMRSAFGYLLLDHASMRGALARIEAQDWGTRDTLSRLALKLPQPRQRAEATLRAMAVARCRPNRLGAMLRARLPARASYLNVGHSNLTDRVLAAVKSVPDVRITVMIHDTIPLDFPQFQRPGTPERFAQLLRRVRAHADLILCNSAVTQGDVSRHAAKWGAVPPLEVAHLGVDPVPPDVGALPACLPPAPPWFVALGTIEPRKNHALLLDIWERFAPTGAPVLVICGARGWNNDAVFARLDQGVPNVIEAPGLSDGAVAALLAGAAGLLFPSHAEGYGLPPVEAAAQGVPVLCGTLPIYRELLGDIPIYADVSDSYLWQQKITMLADRIGAAQAEGTNRREAYVPFSWDAHFNIVLSKA